MTNVFEINDKSGRNIRLTHERWKHIAQEHPDVNIEEIKSTVAGPLAIKPSKYDSEHVRYYYSLSKEKKRYLMVAVKYLNGSGFIITSYYVRNIK